MKDFIAFHEELDKFQIINIVPNGKDIYYTVVDEVKRYDILIKDFKPYFYVPIKNINWHIPFLKMQDTKKIELEHPATYKQEKDKYKFTYEADIPYDIRFSVDMNIKYAHKKASHIQLHIWFTDIEVFRDLKEGRPDFKNKTNIINAISFYDTKLDKYFSIVVVPDDKHLTGRIDMKDNENDIILLKVRDELTLLKTFIHLLNKIQPVIITGWNFLNFDIVYIIQRISTFYPNLLQYLSPYFNVNPILNKNNDFIDVYIPGLTIIDMLNLYKLFVNEKRDAYTLDFIAKEELGEGKVEYSGSLDYLWKNDFDTFLKYSYKDVQLLVELEKKKQFLLLINELKEISGLPLYHFNFSYTLKFNDALILQYIRKLNPSLVYRTKPDKIDEYKISGGYVKIPKIGFHYWVIDLDASSMYPSGILSYNISPETFLGKIDVDRKDIQKYIRPYMFNKININQLPDRLLNVSYIFPNDKVSNIEITKLKKYIYSITSQFTIAPNGAIFDINKNAIIPSIQKDLKDRRKEYKDKMKIWKIFQNYLSSSRL